MSMRRLLALLLAVLWLAAGGVRADSLGREIVQLNRGWTFTLGDPAGMESASSRLRPRYGMDR